MGIADFVARGPQAFTGRFLATFDQAAIRGEVLHAWEAADVMDFIEQHETENLANAGYGLQQIQGVGIMRFGGFEDIDLPFVQIWS